MNNQTYKVKTPTGKTRTYRRITKALARRAFVGGVEVLLCPSNLNPLETFERVKINLTDEQPNEEKGIVTPQQIFDFAVFRFQYYHCRTELSGRRVNFFISSEN